MRVQAGGFAALALSAALLFVASESSAAPTSEVWNEPSWNAKPLPQVANVVAPVAAAKSEPSPSSSSSWQMIERLKTDDAFKTCHRYPLAAMVDDDSIKKDFESCRDMDVGDSAAAATTTEENNPEDVVVPFCLANYLSLEVLCGTPAAAAAGAEVSTPADDKLATVTLSEFVPSASFCVDLNSVLVEFDCAAVARAIPDDSSLSSRCNEFNLARNGIRQIKALESLLYMSSLLKTQPGKKRWVFF
jgi:hypothetical protein